MKMVRVENGQVVDFDLPENGFLSDGRGVSGYKNLPEHILRQEGWLPFEESPAPEVGVNEVAVDNGFEVLPDKVVKRWKKIPRPKSQTEIRRERIQNAKTLEELKAVLLDDAG